MKTSVRILKKTWLLTVLLAGFCVQEGLAEIHVKYNSSENVYIDAGSADSIAVGDTLTVGRGDSLLAEIQVIFVAEHSASCKITKSIGPIEIWATVSRLSKATTLQAAIPKPVADTMRTEQAVSPKPVAGPQKPVPTHLRGSISLQAYYWNDISPSNLDFSQPATRLNLQAARLWGSDFSFTLRSTSRYDHRSRNYSSSVPQSEWRNRFYQLSLGYYSDSSPYSFEAGRIISNRISGIGYIDGIMAQTKISSRFLVGAFGGTQPQWQYSSFQTSLQKYGVFGGYSVGGRGIGRYDLTIALAGEYHGKTVSREFAYVQNNINISSRWNIFQSGEVDINRGWRKTKAGTGLTLTNLYVSTRRQMTSWLSAGLSFDSRKNYWTYEIRSLADSLFDDNLRRGARADLTLRLPEQYLISTSIGVYRRTTDARATYSYSVGMNKANLLVPGLFGNIMFSGFSNPYTDGYNITARLGQSIRRGGTVSVEYGVYLYTIQSSSLRRRNHSIQLNSQMNLVSPIFLSAVYEYDLGDDIKGHRILGELGYRF